MPRQRLLESEQLVKGVTTSVQSASQEILLVSAYLKIEAMNWLLEIIPPHVSVKVLARWRKQDLLNGASDIGVYNLIAERDWGFYIDTDVHTKVMVVDAASMFIGSSNYTSNGLHLFGSGNKELNIEVQPTLSEVSQINDYFSAAYQVTPPMFRFMYEEIEASKVNIDDSFADLEWSLEVQNCFEPIVDKLWVSECIFLSSTQFNEINDERKIHDESLWLGPPSLNKAKAMRIFKWLDYQLKQSQRDLRFGELSSLLHSSLINQPAPYRQEVKVFIRNLFSWVEVLDLYQVVQYNHSKSIVNPYVETNA